MSRYTKSSYRVSRRLGFSTLETGEELARKPFAPGIHGNKKAKKLSNYGVQLQEKQKVRFMYGLGEKQFRKTFDEAGKMKGVHGENLFKFLESRLDNLVYRIGFATTRRGARQLVNHGHITVNDKKVDIPSYRCKPGDVIAIKESDKELAIVENFYMDKNNFDTHELSFYYTVIPNDWSQIPATDYTKAENDNGEIKKHTFVWLELKDINNYDLKTNFLKQNLQNNNYNFEHIIIKE